MKIWGLDVEWRVAMRPSRRRQLEPGSEAAVEERRKASIRAKVEHPFLWVKRRFGLRQGSIPGIGQEHATAGVAVVAYQSDNGGGVTWRPNRAYVCPKQRRG